jgi:hypothetical protein
VGAPFTAVFTITPLADAPRATGGLEAVGIVSALDEPPLQWQNLPADQAVAVRARFLLTGPGEGEIRCTVDVRDDAGRSQYGRSAVLYVVIVDDEVLTGTSSPLLLRVEYLDRQLRAGAITQQEYERAREQLLGGGATGTAGDSAPPASVP